MLSPKRMARLIPANITSLPAVEPCETRLAQRIHVDHESGERGIWAGWQLQLVDLQGIDREVVAVRLVAHRWARAAPARGTEISRDLACTGWQTFAISRTGTLGQTGRRSRQVQHEPMPPACTAGGCIWIMYQDRKALGTRRRVDLVPKKRTPRGVLI